MRASVGRNREKSLSSDESSAEISNPRKHINNIYGGEMGWLATKETQRNYFKKKEEFEHALIHSKEKKMAEMINSFIEEAGTGQAVKGPSPARMARILCELVAIMQMPNAKVEKPFGAEAILTAVAIGNRALVEILLSHFPDSYEFALTEPTLAYPVYLTPLMLASINNNFALVQCFLGKGYRLEPPHRHDCHCGECQDDRTNNHRKRLDSYRAIVSPAFIWLGTKDPFMSCVLLAHDLQKCIETTSKQTAIYESLLSQIRRVAMQIVEHCHDGDEVALLLEHKSGCSISDHGNIMPRLTPVLDSEMKEAAAHPLIQSHVDRRFFGKSELDYLGRFLLIMVAFLTPPISALSSVIIGARFEMFRAPVIRFAGFVSSYCTFLILLLYHQFRLCDLDVRVAKTGERFKFECIIFIYAFSFLLQDVYLLIRKGPTHFFQTWWSWFDYICLSFFALSFVCWLQYIEESDRQSPRKLNRRHLTHADSYIIFESTFRLGTMLAFWRLLYFLQLTQVFGRFIIACFRCVKEYVRYIIVAAFIFFAFALGMSGLLRPYSVSSAEKNDAELSRENSFQQYNFRFTDTLLNLYWCFYGLIDERYSVLRAGYAGLNQNPVEQPVVEFLSLLLTAIYFLVLVLTLSNIMISLMVAIAEGYQDRGEEEWRFERLRVINEFFYEGTLVPPPFNILYLLYLTLNSLLGSMFCQTRKWDIWSGSYPNHFQYFVSSRGTDYHPPYGVSPDILKILEKPSRGYINIVEELKRADEYARLINTLLYRYIQTHESGISDPYSVLSGRKPNKFSADFTQLVRFESEIEVDSPANPAEIAYLSHIMYNSGSEPPVVPSATAVDVVDSMPSKSELPANTFKATSVQDKAPASLYESLIQQRTRGTTSNMKTAVEVVHRKGKPSKGKLSKELSKEKLSKSKEEETSRAEKTTKEQSTSKSKGSKIEKSSREKTSSKQENPYKSEKIRKEKPSRENLRTCVNAPTTLRSKEKQDENISSNRSQPSAAKAVAKSDGRDVASPVTHNSAREKRSPEHRPANTPNKPAERKSNSAVHSVFLN